MAERTCRAIAALEARPSAKAGSVTLRSHCHGDVVIGVKPVAGNHRRPTAKIAASSSPNQKLGIAWPNVAPSVAKRSTRERGLSAAAIPAASPTMMAISAATAVSDTVTGRRCMTASVTLTLLKKEVPRSP